MQNRGRMTTGMAVRFTFVRHKPTPDFRRSPLHLNCQIPLLRMIHHRCPGAVAFIAAGPVIGEAAKQGVERPRRAR